MVDDIFTTKSAATGEKYTAFYPKDFDFNHFEFYSNRFMNQPLYVNLRAHEYKKQFLSANNNRLNRKQIQRTMIDLLCQQIADAVDDRVDPLPQAMQKNKMEFCRMMVKSPKLQYFFQHFTQTLKVILEEEFKNNMDCVELYLNHPRPSKSVGRGGKGRFYPRPRSPADVAQIERTEQIIDAAKEKYRKRHPSVNKQQASTLARIATESDERTVDLNKERPATLASDGELLGEGLGSVGGGSPDKKDPKVKIQDRTLTAAQKKKKQIENEYVQQVTIRTRHLRGLIDEIDDNAMDLRNVIEDREIDHEKVKRHYPNIDACMPGKKIHELMDEWRKEPVLSNKDIENYGSELWVSLAEYERYLAWEQVTGDAYTKLHKKYEAQVRRLKDVTNFTIEALETALIQTQRQLREATENLAMIAAEQESRRAAEAAKASGGTGLVEEFGGSNLIIKNVQESKDIVSKLVTNLRDQIKTREFYEKELRGGNETIDDLQNKLADQTFDRETENKLRKFYQAKLIKLARDVGLYSDNPEKLERFQSINETNPNLDYQLEYMALLDGVEFPAELLAHANKHIGQKNGLAKLQDQFDAVEAIVVEQAQQEEEMRQAPAPAAKGKAAAAQAKIAKKEKNELRLKMERRQAVLDQFRGFIQKAIEGHLDQPVATVDSGLPTAPLPEDAASFVSKATKQKAQKAKEQREKSKAKAGKMVKDMKGTLKGMVQSRKGKAQKADGKPSASTDKQSAGISGRSPRREKERGSEWLGSIRSESLSSDHTDMSGKVGASRPNNLLIPKPSSRALSGRSRAGSKAPTPDDEDESSPASKHEQFLTIPERKLDIRKKGASKSGAKNSAKGGSPKRIGDVHKGDKSDKPMRPTKHGTWGAAKQEQESLEKLKEKTKSPKVRARQGTRGDSSLSRQSSDSASVQSTPRSRSLDSRENLRRESRSPGRSHKKGHLTSEKAKGLGSSLKLKGIPFIYQELERYQTSKYQKAKDEVEEYLEENEKAFHMTAQETTQLQEFVQRELNVKLQYDDFMSMFHSDVGEFFEAFNQILIQQYGLQDINELAGQADRSGDSRVSKRSKRKPKSIQFGDVLKPTFGATGELIGVQLRHEMAQPILLQSQFETTHLKRLIKACIYINRILRDGRNDDFTIKQVDGNTKASVGLYDPKPKGTQVDEKELEVLQQFGHQTLRENLEEMQREEVLDILKRHAISILSAMDPVRRSQYEMAWEDMSFHHLAEYRMENVYNTSQDTRDKSSAQGISFIKYLECVLDKFAQKLPEYLHANKPKNRGKANLIIHDVLAMGKTNIVLQQPKHNDEYDRYDQPPEFNVSQIGYDTPLIKINKFSQTDDSLLESLGLSPGKTEGSRNQLKQEIKQLEATVPKNYLQMKAKNQLIMDKTMQQEFEMTLEMFDLFAQTLQNVDFENVKKNAVLNSLDPKPDQELFDHVYSDRDSDYDSSTSPRKRRAMMRNKKIKESLQNSPTVMKKQGPVSLNDLSSIRQRLQHAISAMKRDIEVQNPQQYASSIDNDITRQSFKDRHYDSTSRNLRTSLGFFTQKSLENDSVIPKYRQYPQYRFAPADMRQNMTAMTVDRQDINNRRIHINSHSIEKINKLKAIRQRSNDHFLQQEISLESKSLPDQLQVQFIESRNKQDNSSRQTSPDATFQSAQFSLRNKQDHKVEETRLPQTTHQNSRNLNQALFGSVLNSKNNSKNTHDGPMSQIAKRKKDKTFASCYDGSADPSQMTNLLEKEYDLNNRDDKSGAVTQQTGRLKKNRKLQRNRKLFNQSVAVEKDSHLLHVNDDLFDAVPGHRGTFQRNMVGQTVWSPNMEHRSITENFMNRMFNINEQAQDITIKQDIKGRRSQNVAAIPQALLAKALEAKGMQWPQQNIKGKWANANELQAAIQNNMKHKKPKIVNYPITHQSIDYSRSRKSDLKSATSMMKKMKISKDNSVENSQTLRSPDDSQNLQPLAQDSAAFDDLIKIHSVHAKNPKSKQNSQSLQKSNLLSKQPENSFGKKSKVVISKTNINQTSAYSGFFSPTSQEQPEEPAADNQALLDKICGPKYSENRSPASTNIHSYQTSQHQGGGTVEREREDRHQKFKLQDQSSQISQIMGKLLS